MPRFVEVVHLCLDKERRRKGGRKEGWKEGEGRKRKRRRRGRKEETRRRFEGDVSLLS